MLRTTCKSLYKLVIVANPFPRHFVLDQQKCLEYYVSLGNLSALKYLENLNFFFTPELCNTAAMAGQLDVLKFLLEHGCTPSIVSSYLAADKGHLDVLKYSLQCIKTKICKLSDTQESKLFSSAATHGHLHIVKYLHENGYKWNFSTLTSAAEGDHFGVFKYAVENGCPLGADPSFGDVKILEYLQARGLPWKRWACSLSANKGNLDALMFAHENGAEWGQTVAAAARARNFNCLKYAIENGAPMNIIIYDIATLEIAKCLVELKVPLDPRVYSNAVENRRMDVLKYLLENTTVEKPEELGLTAAEQGDLDLFKLAIENGFGFSPQIDEIYGEDIVDVYTTLISVGALDCLIYATEKKLQMHLTPQQYFEKMFNVHISKNLKMITWWAEKFDCDFMQCWPLIAENGEVDLIEILEQKGVIFMEKQQLDILNNALMNGNIEMLAYMLKKKRCKFPIASFFYLLWFSLLNFR
jgi:hypothetical protein